MNSITKTLLTYSVDDSSIAFRAANAVDDLLLYFPAFPLLAKSILFQEEGVRAFALWWSAACGAGTFTHSAWFQWIARI